MALGCEKCNVWVRSGQRGGSGVAREGGRGCPRPVRRLRGVGPGVTLGCSASRGCCRIPLPRGKPRGVCQETVVVGLQRRRGLHGFRRVPRLPKRVEATGGASPQSSEKKWSGAAPEMLGVCGYKRRPEACSTVFNSKRRRARRLCTAPRTFGFPILDGAPPARRSPSGRRPARTSVKTIWVLEAERRSMWIRA
jgi:hypothetical protein